MLENYGEVLKPEEVCEILLIGRNSLYKLLWSKKLVGYRDGRNWKITKKAVINYLSQDHRLSRWLALPL
ncbi:MAG: helix-turn-helix domain-containing protein [Clostridiales bacterium]|nr:helix-turn-helix domain-containing protein [Clostridiales bacterium]